MICPYVLKEIPLPYYYLEELKVKKGKIAILSGVLRNTMKNYNPYTNYILKIQIPIEQDSKVTEFGYEYIFSNPLMDEVINETTIQLPVAISCEKGHFQLNFKHQLIQHYLDWNLESTPD